MEAEPRSPDGESLARRHFLTTSGVAMTTGVTVAYGTFAVMLARYSYPSWDEARGWLFVCQVDAIEPGGAIEFTTPTGAKVVIARQGTATDAEGFLALSSVCPHLGCRVHWEAANDRFFCPCHNGAFDRQGVATEGPPKAARQSLVRFPLKVEQGLLYLEAPLSSIVTRVAHRSSTVLPREEASPRNAFVGQSPSGTAGESAAAATATNQRAT